MWLINGAFRGVRGLWSYGCLVILISTMAAIPILQFAAFGYLLECSSRISRKLSWSECIPGQTIARRVVVGAVCVGLSWLAVWYVTDLAYTAGIIEPGNINSDRLRVASFILSFAWVGWIAWALFRGGRIRDFLWPAPIRFIKSVWRPSTWREAEDRLWSFVTSLHVPRLMWTGVMASMGAIIWLAIPASLIMVSLNRPGNGTALLGVIGFPLMVWVLAIVPFLQVQFAVDRKFGSLFRYRMVRDAYKRTPWSMLWGIFILFALSIPLYLLRIEPIPTELNWILTFFFVFFLFPAHLVIGWAWGRSRRNEKRVHWFWRYVSWVPQLAVIISYVGVLYLAKFTSWEGGYVFLLQHTVLPPVPFFLR